jgi:hypothetical protein
MGIMPNPTQAMTTANAIVERNNFLLIFQLIRLAQRYPPLDAFPE